MRSGDVPPPVRVEVLGPLRLVVDGEVVDVPGPKRRALLALLALAEGRMVTAGQLVDALWPSEAPGSGRQALHTHVSRLRAHLGPAATRLVTRQDGYQLELDLAGCDLAQARTLLAQARGGLHQDPAAALALLVTARGLWRGPVLADLVDVGPVAAAVRGCARLYQEVSDALVATAVAAGQADSVAGLAAESLSADPLREPAVLLQMRVLAATGQAPEALRVGREFRHRLAEETGLDPSTALGDLEREIAGGVVAPTPARRAVARPGDAVRSATRLIGREGEVASLHRLLAAERLVTIVGPGGVGKTRVALEIAQRSDAVTLLLLAPLTDPEALPHALAAALNLDVVQGDVLAACVAVLAGRPGLLVIDNCEHLLDAVRDAVATLLSRCPHLTVLATSREPLGLAAECTSRLAPLPLPVREQDGELARVPSVAVFLERARRVRPQACSSPEQLLVVADIVRRLDGMPLAIELAAGRLYSLSLADLHDRLDRSLDLLGGGRLSADSRHRTLRATVEWSYQLLSPAERRIFRHLSVFVDGIDLRTAEALAGDLAPDDDPGTVLARLVDASMLDVSFEGGTRFRMLETLRAYGLDRLAANGEPDAAAERLLRWAVELTAWIGDALTGESEPEADAALRRELGNLRAAWRLARSRGAIDEAAAMVSRLLNAVAYRDLVEIRGWAEELADDPALDAHPRASTVLGVAAEAAYHRGDQAKAERLAHAGLARETDGAGWYCLLPLSVAELARGAYPAVIEHSLTAAALPARPPECLGIAALAMAYGGDPDQARRTNDEGLADARSPSMRSWGAYVTGEIESLAGHRELAEQQYLRAIDLARRSGATFLVGVATVGLLAVRADGDRVPEVLAGYREVIDYFARTGNWTHLWATLRNLAQLLRRLGDLEPATLLDAAADGAPDAPAVDPQRGAGGRNGPAPRTTVPGRADVLELARQAIDRHLDRHLARPEP